MQEITRHELDGFWDALVGFAVIGALSSLALVFYAGYRFSKEIYESIQRH